MTAQAAADAFSGCPLVAEPEQNNRELKATMLSTRTTHTSHFTTHAQYQGQSCSSRSSTTLLACRSPRVRGLRSWVCF